MTTEDQLGEADNPIHATSVMMIDGRALLLAGPSGCGKSDLALRLIDRGATLVSDDYTALSTRGGTLFARAPATIAGRIEVRSVGIYDITFAREAPVALLLALDEAPLRLPCEPIPTRTLLGVAIPVLPLSALEASAAIKAEAALRLHGLAVTA
jgi:serine kinase of HPr protein (carbohydrate metabolism regulator)